MSEGAERAVAQEHVAAPQPRVRPGRLTHLVDIQAHHRQRHDHAAGQVQQPQELDGREPAPLLLRARLRPEFLQPRRVGRGHRSRVRHEHAASEPPRGVINASSTIAT